MKKVPGAEPSQVNGPAEFVERTLESAIFTAWRGPLGGLSMGTMLRLYRKHCTIVRLADERLHLTFEYLICVGFQMRSKGTPAKTGCNLICRSKENIHLYGQLVPEPLF